MSTTVAGLMLRSETPWMFDDLALDEFGQPVPWRAHRDGTGLVSVTFAADLPHETALAVWRRMTSRDDDDATTRDEMGVRVTDAPVPWAAPTPLPEGPLDSDLAARVNYLSASLEAVSAQLVEAVACCHAMTAYVLGEQYRPTEPNDRESKGI